MDEVAERVATNVIGRAIDSWERPVCIAGTVWATSDRVLKVQSGLDVADVAGETELLKRLPASTLRPDVLDHGIVEGRPWLLMRRMPGVTARDCWDRLSVGARERLLRCVAQHLRERAQIELPVVAGAVRFGLPWPLRATESRAAAEKALDEAAATGLLVERHTNALGEIFELGFAAALPHSQLAHGNLHLGNVLCDPKTGAVTGLVDWEMAMWAPADVDVDELLRTLTHPTLGVIADDQPWPRVPIGSAGDWISDELTNLLTARGARDRLRAYQASFLLIRVPRRYRWSPQTLPPVLTAIEDLVSGRSHLDG